MPNTFNKIDSWFKTKWNLKKKTLNNFIIIVQSASIYCLFIYFYIYRSINLIKTQKNACK